VELPVFSEGVYALGEPSNEVRAIDIAYLNLLSDLCPVQRAHGACDGSGRQLGCQDGVAHIPKGVDQLDIP